MKKTFYLLLLISLQNCSQSKTTMINQNLKITENNLIQEIGKEVKEYREEPIYFITYESENCFFEVYLNGLLCFKQFKNGSSSTAFSLNHCILKSGVQNILIKLYPIIKREGSTKDYSTFVENTVFNIKVSVPDNRNKDISGKIVKTYELPSSKGNDLNGNIIDKFIATGKTSFEDSFTFEATVPYQLQGFDKMQDLRKMDKNVLEQKLLAKYQEVWQVYNNKQYDDIAKISFENLKNESISEYKTTQEIKETWETLLSIYKQSSFEMQPLKDYKLQFFGDGRLVALMQTSLDRRVRGNTALWAKVDYEGGIRPLFCNRYFYIPEGETEFKVY